MGGGITAGAVLRLQRRAGNQAVVDLLAGGQPDGFVAGNGLSLTAVSGATRADRSVVQRVPEGEGEAGAEDAEDSGPSFDPEDAVGEMAAGAEIVGGYSEDTGTDGQSSSSTGEGPDLQAFALQRQGSGGSSGEVDVGKLIEAIFETEPFKSLKKSLLDKAEKMWNDLSAGVKVPAIVVAGGGALAGLGASYKAPGGIPPFGGGITSPAIKLYENKSSGVKIELKFSGKAAGGQWQGTAVLQGRF